MEFTTARAQPGHGPRGMWEHVSTHDLRDIVTTYRRIGIPIRDACNIVYAYGISAASPAGLAASAARLKISLRNCARDRAPSCSPSNPACVRTIMPARGAKWKLGKIGAGNVREIDNCSICRFNIVNRKDGRGCEIIALVKPFLSAARSSQAFRDIINFCLAE